MRLIRAYYGDNIYKNDLPKIISLDSNTCNHLLKVLRLKNGDTIAVINNSCGYYLGTLINTTKKTTDVILNEYIEVNNESNIYTHLGQVISRGEKMDLTIQKAVELGISEITPLFSSRCDVSLSIDRLEKKMIHWQNIIISACLQSQRNIIPTINKPLNLKDWINSLSNDEVKLNLNPHNGVKFRDLKIQNKNSFSILIGSEAGLSNQEIELANQNNFININLGPRVLRTETAGLVTISILQSMYGDL